MQAKAEKIALFRYGAIASLVLEPLPRGELTRRAQEIAAHHFDIPDTKRSAISVDTLLSWALRYRNGGLEARAPQPRQDRGKSRTITPQLADLIELLKRENPHRTGATLLRELALSAGQGKAGISASTLYRFLKQRSLSERQLLAPQAHKKFEANPDRGEIQPEKRLLQLLGLTFMPNVFVPNVSSVGVRCVFHDGLIIPADTSGGGPCPHSLSPQMSRFDGKLHASVGQTRSGARLAWSDSFRRQTRKDIVRLCIFLMTGRPSLS
jgi:hypothetical protein